MLLPDACMVSFRVLLVSWGMLFFQQAMHCKAALGGASLYSRAFGGAIFSVFFFRLFWYFFSVSCAQPGSKQASKQASNTERIWILSEPLIETLWLRIGGAAPPQTPPLSFSALPRPRVCEKLGGGFSTLAKEWNRNWQMRVRVPDM